MSLISRLYASNALQARRGSGHAKVKAGQRHMHKGTRSSAVTIMRPDADGNLREASVERSAKRVRWDEAGAWVVRS